MCAGLSWAEPKQPGAGGVGGGDVGTKGGQAGGEWMYVCMFTLYSGSMSSSISLPVRVRTLGCAVVSMLVERWECVGAFARVKGGGE